jgi:hypothetical protein
MLLAVTVCNRDATPPPTGATTGPGEGGCPHGPPEALFTVTIQTDDGAPLPSDTTVSVRWSAGEEPAFVLDDPTTWKTLDDGVNAVCEPDAQAGPVALLRCELWTSGATEVAVTATGYLELRETLTPATKEGCEEPIPSETALELDPEPDSKD